MGKSAKSQIAVAAKKYRPIKSFFVTKIPTTSDLATTASTAFAAANESGLRRGEVPYASPSTDEDDSDRTKQAMLWEKESDDEVPCAFLSVDEDDCDQKLPAARPAVLSRDTVMEIIHLVSQQSNAFEKPTIAELEIMLHAMSNMHEPSVVQCE
jgi:hypothetical protein